MTTNRVSVPSLDWLFAEKYFNGSAKRYLCAFEDYVLVSRLDKNYPPSVRLNKNSFRVGTFYKTLDGNWYYDAASIPEPVMSVLKEKSNAD